MDKCGRKDGVRRGEVASHEQMSRLMVLQVGLVLSSDIGGRPQGSSTYN